MDKYHPGYFGKVGMRTFHYKRNPDYCKGINIDRLWSLVPAGVYETAKADTTKAPVIDVTKLVRLIHALLFLLCVPSHHTHTHTLPYLGLLQSAWQGQPP